MKVQRWLTAHKSMGLTQNARLSPGMQCRLAAGRNVHKVSFPCVMDATFSPHMSIFLQRLQHDRKRCKQLEQWITIRDGPALFCIILQTSTFQCFEHFASSEFSSFNSPIKWFQFTN